MRWLLFVAIVSLVSWRLWISSQEVGRDPTADKAVWRGQPFNDVYLDIGRVLCERFGGIESAWPRADYDQLRTVGHYEAAASKASTSASVWLRCVVNRAAYAPSMTR